VKIVLKQDVDNLGDRGAVVNVAPGYARNFLFPKGMALAATPGNMRQIELQNSSPTGPSRPRSRRSATRRRAPTRRPLAPRAC